MFSCSLPRTSSRDHLRSAVLHESRHQRGIAVPLHDGAACRLLAGLEETIEKRMEALREDLNTRMLWAG